MTETAVETYETTTRGAASMAAYRAVRILQLLSENTGEDKAMLSDELIRRLAHPDDPARMPISAARRSIYTAISALRHAGYEIEYKRGVGYKLLTRPLTDEEIIRLHGMVMRNRSTPIAIRKSMAQHLVAMASADVRGYLDRTRACSKSRQQIHQGQAHARQAHRHLRAHRAGHRPRNHGEF